MAENGGVRTQKTDDLPDKIINTVAAIAMTAGLKAKQWRLAYEPSFFAQSRFLEYYALPPRLIERKPDGSPVTEADRQVNRFILDELALLTPDIPVVTKENTLEANQEALKKGKGTYWCIAPIHGTSSFINGQHDWGVMIGLVKDGVPTLGVACYPELHQLYYTDYDPESPGGGNRKLAAHYEDSYNKLQGFTKLNVAEKHPPEALSVPRAFSQHFMSQNRRFPSETFTPPTPEDELKHLVRWGDGTIYPREPHRRYPPQNELLVAKGKLDLSFVPQRGEDCSPALWDVVAPMAILRAAGGGIFLHDGHGNDLSLPDFTHPPENLKMPPFLTGHPGTLENYGLLGRATRRLLEESVRPTPGRA